jgi:hypothetical protein
MPYKNRLQFHFHLHSARLKTPERRSYAREPNDSWRK